MYVDYLVYYGCLCNEFYEYKVSVVDMGDCGCMMENMGCKGIQVYVDCNIWFWNGQGFCINGGYFCINCIVLEFEEFGYSFC